MTQPSLLQIVSVVSTAEKCYGDSSGSIVLQATGGTGPLMYRISNKPFTSSNTFNNLKQGEYSLTIRDSNNCLLTKTASIGNASAMASILQAKPITCYGVNNGSAKATIIGGRLPYAYFWNTNPPQTNSNASNLSSGWKTLMVTDSIGCKVYDSVYIEPKAYYKGDSICAVSIDTSMNKPVISWVKTNGKGIAKYYVYARQNSLSNFVLRDSVAFGLNPNFIDTLPSANPNTTQYLIRSIDSCGQVSVASALHQAVNISVSGLGNNRTVFLNPYIGLSGGKYLLYRSTNGAPFAFIDTVKSLSYTDAMVPAGSNKYLVKYVSNNACAVGIFSNVVVTTITGLSQINGNASKIQLYPNPVQTKLIIETNTTIQIEAVSLKGLDGKTLKRLVFSNPIMPLEMDLQEIADGVYLVEIEAENMGKVVFKIVKGLAGG